MLPARDLPVVAAVPLRRLDRELGARVWDLSLGAWTRARLLPRRGWERLRRLPPQVWAETSLLAAIFGYGSLLRFEAFQRAYGPLLGSDLFMRLQNGLADLVAWIRPASFYWPRAPMPYGTDARSYLLSARQLEHIYDAGLREPLFGFSTKVGLWLTGGQDISVSMVSSTFSALLIVATYGLGREIGGRAVGVFAALFVAIDPELIRVGIRGYRDDLFALLVVVFAWACIRFYRQPSIRATALTAIVGSAACLTRITALSFVVPGLAAVAASGLVGRRREAVTRAAVAAILVLVLIAPFLINCWIEYGDPLYSLNWHTTFYRQRSGMEASEGMSAAGYVGALFNRAPLSTLDTALRGLTHYPWRDKWAALERHWGEPLGGALKYLCLVGMLMWLWIPKGRLALVVLTGSMLPYAFTWEIGMAEQARLTLHTYPFFLAAATYALVRPVRWLSAARTSERSFAGELRGLAPRAFLASGLAVGFVGLLYLFPAVIVYHELANGRPASVGGDNRKIFDLDREFVFFGGGWSPARTEGDVTFHYPEGDGGRIWVPMDGEQEYRCLLRLDPVPREGEELRVIEFRVNRWSQRFAIRDQPGTVDRYWFRIPAAVVRSGPNRVEIVEVGGRRSDPGDIGQPSGRREPAFKLWYLRFFPHTGAEE